MRASDLEYYRAAFDAISPDPRKRSQIVREAKRVIAGRDAYFKVQQLTGVPWVFHGCIHEMESDANFLRQILNGQKWDRVTTIVPVGVGPWKSWADAAMYALQNRRKSDKTWIPLDEITDWTVPNLLRQWERWNGGGYMKRGKHSPYLFAGCTLADDSGYYTSDHGYDPNAKSQQIGAAVLLREIIAIGKYANPMDDIL